MSDTSFYLGLRKKAEELYPEDTKLQDDFVQGFVEKVANVFGKSFAEHSLGDAFFTRGMAQAAGKATVGLGLGLGVAGLMGVAKVIGDNRLYDDFRKALNVAIAENRILKAADPAKVRNFAETIFKFAPHVATDPNLLSSILANAIHGEGIDPMTIRTLTELESRYQGLGDKKFFDPKSFI